jgi:general secretion pathway protein I
MNKWVNYQHKQSMTKDQTATQGLQPQRGFTLLEIMAALSILAIVLVSVYRLQAQTVAMNSEVRFYATAPMLAQLKMAEVESESPEDLGDDSGDFGEEFPDYRWNIVIDDVESTALGNITQNLKKIDLLVSFNNNEFTYSIRSYKFLKD